MAHYLFLATGENTEKMLQCMGLTEMADSDSIGNTGSKEEQNVDINC